MDTHTHLHPRFLPVYFIFNVLPYLPAQTSGDVVSSHQVTLTLFCVGILHVFWGQGWGRQGGSCDVTWYIMAASFPSPPTKITVYNRKRVLTAVWERSCKELCNVFWVEGWGGVRGRGVGGGWAGIVMQHPDICSSSCDWKKGKTRFTALIVYIENSWIYFRGSTWAVFISFLSQRPTSRNKIINEHDKFNTEHLWMYIGPWNEDRC